MDRKHFRRLSVYLAIGAGLPLVLTVLLALIEQRRTQAELGAVASALFRDEVLKDIPDLGRGHEVQVILQREAHSAENWRARRKLVLDQYSWFAQSSRTTRASFLLSNIFSADIPTELHLPKGAQSIFFRREEAEKTAPRDFQKRFPNNVGYFVVSQAGLNLNKTEALLYVDHYCGGLCGGGGYLLLRKTSGIWRVVDQHGTWIS